MKKIFILVPIIGILLLTGCNANNNQKSSTAMNKEYTIKNDETTTASDSEEKKSTETTETETTKADSKKSDSVQSVNDDKFAYTLHDNLMDIDSDKGPYYIINLDTMQVVDCTSKGAKVVDYSKEGDTLSITLYSDEYPVNSTYVVDLKSSTSDTVTKQSIENNVLKFSSQKGPDYQIDLNSMKLISCSDNTGRIVKSEKDGNKLTLIVYSDTLPVDMTYTFTIK